MNKIILASNSAQRKKLLELLGVKFSVKPSRVMEQHKITKDCAALVKDNALLKARDVAERVKKGVVVGADTVVYIGNRKIIGKPRDFRDARRILKVFFAKPCWVYTGVAVLDASTGKRVVDYEKTRVFMSPLSNKEIEHYHRRVHPFDKAGGFDIEGTGSLFIRRIEGCYTNVIGLPMPKLYQMLKKVGVHLL